MIDVTDSNKKYYYHFDSLGSVVALSDTSGNIVERYEYDVFGEPNRVSDVNNPYYFTARRLDTETGLYYYRARYYKPEIGRFMSADPLGTVPDGKASNPFLLLLEYYDKDSINLYRYVLNNPIMKKDPLGLKVPGYSGDCFKDCETITRKWYSGCNKKCNCGKPGAVHLCQIAAGTGRGACYTCCADNEGDSKKEDGCIRRTLLARNAAYVACK